MRRMEMLTAGGGQASGYGARGRSPVGLGGAIAVHAVVAGVFLLTPREMITPYVPQILIGRQIPLDPPPPPEPQKQEAVKEKPQQKAEERPTAADPIVPIKPFNPDDLMGSTKPGFIDGAGAGAIVTPPPADPPREPVLVDASIAPGAVAGFQPDYPGSMIRQGLEGSVTVRVTIGTDGRVTDIEKVSATDEAFWIATQRHALRKWRFRPATRDGVPVSATKVLTVRFTLTDK